MNTAITRDAWIETAWKPVWMHGWGTNPTISNWILISGSWDDSKVWIDSEVWKDG